MSPEHRAQFDTWDADTQARFQAHASRSTRNRAAGRHDQSVGLGGPDSEAHWWANGMAGLAEDYAADRLGTARNTATVPDGGAGDVVWNGLRVDVKWTPGATGRLFAPAHLADHLLADLYVLVTGDDPYRFALVGFATRRALVQAPVQDFGYGPTLALNQRRLSPADQLTVPLEAWW